MGDNEIMVLMYETIQQLLGQFKDTRIVIQQLCNRVGSLEKTVNDMNTRTVDIKERLDNVELAISNLEDGVNEDINKISTESGEKLATLDRSNIALKSTIDAMRGTLENVTTPGIELVAESSKSMKESMRELSDIHGKMTDELVTYQLRLNRIEDTIAKILMDATLSFDKNIINTEDKVNNDT